MDDPDLALRDAAVSGDRTAVRALVSRLAPVIQVRVARCLLRHASASTRRNVREEVQDLTQEVLVRLYDSDARVLRSWDPDKGMSLDGFVGMVATRHALSLLRTRRHSPWSEDPLEHVDGLCAPASGPESRVATREILDRIVAQLEGELSPQGLELFELIVVQGLDAPEVVACTGLSRDAVYAWRSRLLRLVRQRATALVTDAEPVAHRRRGGSHD